MLNPSTADHLKDDPTIRRCMGFARRLNCGGLMVGNLFSVRARNPKDMLAASDPVGPDNHGHIQRMANLVCFGSEQVTGLHGFCVAAWGSHGNYMGQDETVKGWFHDWNIPLWSLGVTKEGHPRHPLYLKVDSELRKLA